VAAPGDHAGRCRFQWTAGERTPLNSSISSSANLAKVSSNLSIPKKVFHLLALRLAILAWSANHFRNASIGYRVARPPLRRTHGTNPS